LAGDGRSDAGDISQDLRIFQIISLLTVVCI